MLSILNWNLQIKRTIRCSWLFYNNNVVKGSAIEFSRSVTREWSPVIVKFEVDRANWFRFELEINENWSDSILRDRRVAVSNQPSGGTERKEPRVRARQTTIARYCTPSSENFPAHCQLCNYTHRVLKIHYTSSAPTIKQQRVRAASDESVVGHMQDSNTNENNSELKDRRQTLDRESSTRRKIKEAYNEKYRNAV